MNQVKNTKPSVTRYSWLYKIGGAAALAAGLLLMIGGINLILAVLQADAANNWSSFFLNNWLIKIFLLHAEFLGIQADLYGLNLLDIMIMFLIGMICFSFSRAFGKTGRTWIMIAFALSIIAILLFIKTQNAGRSTVMLAVLIISLVMLRDEKFYKPTGYTGILASVSLFIGDLSVGFHSNIITILFGIGYVLLTIWLFQIVLTLFLPGRFSRK